MTMTTVSPDPTTRPPATATLTDRLMAEVYVHLDRCNNAPNEAVRFAEHAQALGLLTAVNIVKETP